MLIEINRHVLEQLVKDKEFMYQLVNNWTIETEDYSPSAHFEHTVVVTDDGYEVLTGVMQNGKE